MEPKAWNTIHNEDIYFGYRRQTFPTVGFHFRICRAPQRMETLPTGSQEMNSEKRLEQTNKPQEEVEGVANCHKGA